MRVLDVADRDAAPALARLFTDVGLEAPRPLPVMRTDHQIAQKLHAVSSPGNERARDLVDLQLLEQGEKLDLHAIRATCTRLFTYRDRQPWPPRIVPGPDWSSLYSAAAEGLDVHPTVDGAVTRITDLVSRIDTAT